MLLHIMSLAGDIAIDDPAGAQTHPGGLPLCRIGLLGLRDADLEAHALELGRARRRHRGRRLLARALRLAAPLGHLAERCEHGGRAAELAGGREGGGGEAGRGDGARGAAGDEGAPDGGGEEAPQHGGGWLWWWVGGWAGALGSCERERLFGGIARFGI